MMVPFRSCPKIHHIQRSICDFLFKGIRISGEKTWAISIVAVLAVIGNFPVMQMVCVPRILCICCANLLFQNTFLLMELSGKSATNQFGISYKVFIISSRTYLRWVALCVSAYHIISRNYQFTTTSAEQDFRISEDVAY